MVKIAKVFYTRAAIELDVGGEPNCKIVVEDTATGRKEVLPFSWEILQYLEEQGVLVNSDLWDADPDLKPSEFFSFRKLDFS